MWCVVCGRSRKENSNIAILILYSRNHLWRCCQPNAWLKVKMLYLVFQHLSALSTCSICLSLQTMCLCKCQLLVGDNETNCKSACKHSYTRKALKIFGPKTLGQLWHDFDVCENFEPFIDLIKIKWITFLYLIPNHTINILIIQSLYKKRVAAIIQWIKLKITYMTWK